MFGELQVPSMGKGMVCGGVAGHKAGEGQVMRAWMCYANELPFCLESKE